MGSQRSHRIVFHSCHGLFRWIYLLRLVWDGGPTPAVFPGVWLVAHGGAFRYSFTLAVSEVAVDSLLVLRMRLSISVLDTLSTFFMPRLNRLKSTVLLNCSAVSGGFSSRALLPSSLSSGSGRSAMLCSLCIPGQLFVGQPTMCFSTVANLSAS